MLIDLKVDKLTLPKDSNIYAAQYDLYLPDKNELQARRKSWIEEFGEQEDWDFRRKNATLAFQ